MIYNVYSVLDVTVGYGVPVIQDNDAVAMRAFENGCSDVSSVWHTHPADFHLYCVGTFDTQSGELTAEPPRKICAATDFVTHLSINHNVFYDEDDAVILNEENKRNKKAR